MLEQHRWIYIYFEFLLPWVQVARESDIISASPVVHEHHMSNSIEFGGRVERLVSVLDLRLPSIVS